MFNLFKMVEFQDLVKAGTIVFVGKGGLSFRDMESFHESYIREFGNYTEVKFFKDVIDMGLLISRSAGSHPDQSLFSIIKSKMRDHVNQNSVEFSVIDKYINNKLYNKENDIVYPAFYRDISSFNLDKKSMETVSRILFSADVEAHSTSMPHTYTFPDFMIGPIGSLMHRESDSGDSILTFLYNPDIFVSLLSLFVPNRAIEHLLKLPSEQFRDFAAFNHRDFSEAYHRIIKAINSLCADEVVTRSAQSSHDIPNFVKKTFEESLEAKSAGIEVKGIVDLLSGLINAVLYAHQMPSIASNFIAPFYKNTQARVGVLIHRLSEPAFVEFARRVRSLR